MKKFAVGAICILLYWAAAQYGKVERDKAERAAEVVKATEAAERAKAESAWKTPEGAEVIIPKGVYGWGYLNQLQKSRDAYRNGDNATVTQILSKNLRHGTIVMFSKKTKAKVVDDMGEYLALIPDGIGMKMYFVADNIDKNIRKK